MITIFHHKDGVTVPATRIERSWLGPASGGVLWVDLAAPSIPDSLILSDTFGFHPLSVEDAMGPMQFPKVEAYEGYLYAILHGVDKRTEGRMATRQVDFFVGSHFLVTVHDGHSRSIGELIEYAPRTPTLLAEGPVALFHRIADAMVDHFWPEVEQLQERVDDLEKRVFERPDAALVHELISDRRAIGFLRRVAVPQRDVVSRLARREFIDINTEMAFRFRDVYDNLVRVVDDGALLQERLGDLLAVVTGARHRRWI